MRNNKFYITYGQVSKISIENRTIDLDTFTDKLILQQDINKFLDELEDFDETQQKATDVLFKSNELHESSNFDDIYSQFKDLNTKKEKPRKIVTLPIVEAVIKDSVERTVSCIPLASNLTEVPKLGS